MSIEDKRKSEAGRVRFWGRILNDFAPHYGRFLITATGAAPSLGPGGYPDIDILGLYREAATSLARDKR